MLQTVPQSTSVYGPLLAEYEQKLKPPTAVDLARKVGLGPDPWQEEVLASTADKMLLNCSRQAGKSTIVSLLGAHTAIYDPGALVLMLSPSLRQSQEIFRKSLAVYRELGRPVARTRESALQLELETGSRIVSLPGKENTIRGFSGVRLLIVDEAARVHDELVKAVRPMLAVSGGRMVALSTPFGKRGWFYETWSNGEGWEQYKIPATQCPRISAEFLAEERQALGDKWFAQEYMCSFEEVDGSLFSIEQIEAMTEPWQPPPPLGLQ